MRYEFESKLWHMGHLEINPTETQIKEEPMLFRATPKFAYENGGPITREFLRALGNREEDEAPIVVIDSRKHMLMPGMWPCIPGWHHDDVPRTGQNGQPNYDTPSYKSSHAMAIVGDCSITEFAIGKITLPKVLSNVYKEWNKMIDSSVQENKLNVFQVSPLGIYYFDWQSFHRGCAATKRGWRYFIRASWNTDVKPRNEIRQQTQVYMQDPYIGW